MWVVQIVGDKFNLAALAQSRTSNDINISRDGQDYVLMSDQFAETDDADVVRQKAEKLVVLLKGASYLVLGPINSIRVGAVYRCREDGTGDTFVFPEPLLCAARLSFSGVELTDADGAVKESHPADLAMQLASAAFQNKVVADVLRISAGGTLDWGNLYCIWEIVKKDVEIVAKGWATKKEIDLFKQTANRARHGCPKGDPPEHPMTISKARALIEKITLAWFRCVVWSKGTAEQGAPPDRYSAGTPLRQVSFVVRHDESKGAQSSGVSDIDNMASGVG